MSADDGSTDVSADDGAMEGATDDGGIDGVMDGVIAVLGARLSAPPEVVTVVTVVPSRVAVPTRLLTGDDGERKGTASASPSTDVPIERRDGGFAMGDSVISVRFRFLTFGISRTNFSALGVFGVEGACSPDDASAESCGGG
mmetsp:Transcript_72/g.168  ORF Transcript_72/g.168 Transcript_72/m.168 type:complete len:142 (-) Transcript_72:78-503(-)